LRAVADEHGIRVAGLDQSDCGRRHARIEPLGYRVDRFESKLGEVPSDRIQKVGWHQHPRGVEVRHALCLRVVLAGAADLVAAAAEYATAMEFPVAQFVCDREPLPAVGRTPVYRDDRRVAVPYDPRLAPIKPPVLDPGAQVPSDRFDVDLLRFGHSELT